MEPAVISSPTVSASTTPLPFGGFDIFSTVGDFFATNDSLPSSEGILGFLNTIWLSYTIFAYLISIFMLVLYVYASTGKREMEALNEETIAKKERLYEEKFKTGPKNNRIQDMFDHVSSDSPSDWKLAIIEADIVLDEILKEKGYAGISLGERLKSISPSQLQSLDDAWQAHKVRNQVAHGGADFILTHKLAQDTIKQYRRVFNEFGVM